MARFGILSCEYRENWKSTARERRPNVEGSVNQHVEAFVDTFGDATDQWRAFSCPSFEWPSVEAARRFDALFITGSAESAYDASVPWIADLGRMIQRYAEVGVRIVGICFGSQILATALGGRVGKNPGPYSATVEDVQVSPALSELMGGNVQTIAMIQSHGDQVLQLPEGAVRLGTSETAENEIWCRRNVLAVQGHPELTPRHMFKIILPKLKQRGCKCVTDATDSERRLYTKKRTTGPLIRLVKEFSHNPGFLRQASYRALFPVQVNSQSDAPLITEIQEIANRMTETLWDVDPAVRNPAVDEETETALQRGIQILTEQFSTLMLKELKRVLLDHEGIRLGNTIIHEDAKTLLYDTLGLHEPFKSLRSERGRMTAELEEMLAEVEELVESLEVSAQLLEQQTQALRQRLSHQGS